MDNDKKGIEAKGKLHGKWKERCILIDFGNIEDITQLRKNNNEVNFRNWIKKKYPKLINQIEDSYNNMPDGETKNIGNNFNKFISKIHINKKAINPLNNREEDVENIFKQLWVKYLKDNNEISKDLYLEFKKFIKDNIKFGNG